MEALNERTPPDEGEQAAAEPCADDDDAGAHAGLIEVLNDEAPVRRLDGLQRRRRTAAQTAAENLAGTLPGETLDAFCARLALRDQQGRRWPREVQDLTQLAAGRPPPLPVLGKCYRLWEGRTFKMQCKQHPGKCEIMLNASWRPRGRAGERQE